ncbi:MAG TPA: GntR family transcriptional regulator [Propionibacteriaceae bacterium]|nr:GntR family transcriptional regulator [Propionibacteriaceae bacterium]
MASSPDGGPVRLERRALRDSAYDMLLNMLLDGSLRPDVNLSIDGLARDLGVSPTPIREALVNLEHTGLVTRTALRGYRVAPPFNAEQIGQLVDARSVVELGALDQALLRRGELIPVLRRAHEHHQQVIASIDAEEESLTGGARIASYRRYFDADWGFHLVMMRHAGNPFIVQLAESLGAHVHRLRQTVGVGLTDSHEASTEHAQILTALETGAPDAAVKQALREHLESVRSRSIADSKLVEGRTGQHPAGPAPSGVRPPVRGQGTY